MSKEVTVNYQFSECVWGPVKVSPEVAEFLAEDGRRLAAQKRRDRRRLAYTTIDPDIVLETRYATGRDYLLDTVIGNLEVQALREAVGKLPQDEKLLIYRRYHQELTQQQIGHILGISKMAVSKRLKKLHRKLRDILSASVFCCRLVYKSFLTVLIYRGAFPGKDTQNEAQTHRSPAVC